MPELNLALPLLPTATRCDHTSVRLDSQDQARCCDSGERGESALLRDLSAIRLTDSTLAVTSYRFRLAVFPLIFAP